MKRSRYAWFFCFLLLSLPGYADEELSIVPHKLIVEARSARDRVDHYKRVWKKEWNSDQAQAEKMWRHLQRNYREFQKSLIRERSEFREGWRQVNSFFNSK